MFRPRPARRLIPTVVIVVALGLGAADLYGAVSAEHPSTVPQMQTSASGSMSAANSKDGAAIFAIADMAPGATAQGEVTIANTGTVPGSLALSSFDRSDTPASRGPLSQRLQLRLADVGSRAGNAIYAGSLASMPELQVGTLAAGESRTYRFTVSMLDGGPPPTPWAGDNIFQAATATISYDWTLTEAADLPPVPVPPDPVPPDPVTPDPVVPVTPAEPCTQPLTGDDYANKLIGTPGDDLIFGQGGEDLILGEAGNDCLFGGAGADSINGGAGNDRLDGGPGRDRIYGGPGSDTIFARDGQTDSINCGSGRDSAFVDHRDLTRSCEIVHRAP